MSAVRSLALDSSPGRIDKENMEWLNRPYHFMGKWRNTLGALLSSVIMKIFAVVYVADPGSPFGVGNDIGV